MLQFGPMMVAAAAYIAGGEHIVVLAMAMRADSHCIDCAPSKAIASFHYFRHSFNSLKEVN